MTAQHSPGDGASDDELGAKADILLEHAEYFEQRDDRMALAVRFFIKLERGEEPDAAERRAFESYGRGDEYGSVMRAWPKREVVNAGLAALRRAGRL